MGGADEYEGRVEVCYNGVYGTVTDDQWGTDDAIVVCRSLGFLDTCKLREGGEVRRGREGGSKGRKEGVHSPHAL